MLETKFEPTHNLDFDICQCSWLVEKIRNNKNYAQNLYAAMCNQDWQYQDVWGVLTNQKWGCSWRSAGGIVADIRGGDENYMDWYCSGMTENPDNHGHTPMHYVKEGTVTDEIRQDLVQIGWIPVDSNST
jgi:hypothetical protein